MKKPIIVNVSDFISPDELAALEALGFIVYNYPPTKGATSVDLPSVSTYTEVSGLLRAQRLESAQYSDLYEALASRGIRIRNTPKTSGLLSEFALHYPLITEVSPRALVFPSETSAEEIVAKANDAGIGPNLFIKTERKSLKGASMIDSMTVEKVRNCLQALTKAFQPFKTYVVKEVVPLEFVDHRAIVFGTHIAGFDTGPHVGREDFMVTREYEFVNTCVGQLARNGLVGDYVIDVAKRIDRETFVIVEMKDLQFTILKNPRFIWKQIANHCPLE